MTVRRGTMIEGFNFVLPNVRTGADLMAFAPSDAWRVQQYDGYSWGGMTIHGGRRGLAVEFLEGDQTVEAECDRWDHPFILTLAGGMKVVYPDLSSRTHVLAPGTYLPLLTSGHLIHVSVDCFWCGFTRGVESRGRVRPVDTRRPFPDSGSFWI